MVPRHDDPTNDSRNCISIAHGKQGRHDPRSPVADMLEIVDTVRMDRETLEDDTVDSIAATVRELAARHQGHRFDAAYMAEHDGAYGISAVLLDTQLNATHAILPLFRPTSAGGHVFLRTKKTIAEVIEKTHDAVPIDAAGSKDLSILVGKLRGLECIVCFPDSMTEHPKLIRAFALDGIAGAETVVVSLRVCDANGLGRSAPKMCCGKFKFLFPGAPVDASQVVSRKKHKASAQPTQSAHTATPSRPSRAVKDKLNAMLRTQYDLHRDTKGFLCCVAKNFIESLGIELDEDTFNTKLDVYLPLDPEVVVVLFGSLETCRSIATSALGDATKVDHVMKTVAAHRDLLRDSMQHNTHSTPRTS